MPIPAFDSILNVIPPHLGDPRRPGDLTPYPCTISELTDRFATSDHRKRILEGLLNLRNEFFSLGISGFQWIGGSFVEDIESQERRHPADVDIVTFVANPANPTALADLLNSRKPELLNKAHVKATYMVDHFFLPLLSPPHIVVNQTRYWCGLFSHRRDRQWKGMLVALLRDPKDDTNAQTILKSKP